MPEPYQNITITALSPIWDFFSICLTETLTFSLRKLAETKPRTLKQGSTRPAGQSHIVTFMPRHAATAFVLKLLCLIAEVHFTASALRRTVLEDLPGSVHKLSVSHLPWAADLLWFYFPLGFLPPPLGDLYAATVCVPYTCHQTNHKGRGPKTPTLAVALGMGLALQFAESRTRGPAASYWPQSVAKASYTSGYNSPYLRTRPLGI